MLREMDLPAKMPGATAHNEFRRMRVIINPASGIDRPILRELNVGLKDSGLEWDVAITHAAGDAERLAAESAELGFDLIAAHGGDGTVMEVAMGARKAGLPMAIIPGGTANMMAVELGIPIELSSSITMLALRQYRPVTVDMGHIRLITPGEGVLERTFLLRLGIGLEAAMMQNANQEAKHRFGVLAYVFSGLQELANCEPTHYRLELDGEACEADGISCMIANSGAITLDGKRLSSNMSVSDGLLDVVVFQRSDPGSLLAVAASVLMTDNSATDRPELLHWQAKRIVLESDPMQTISVDGEIVPHGRIEAEVIPSAVTILGPEPAP